MTTLWDTIKKGILDGAKIARDSAQIAADKAEELSKKGKVKLDINNIKRKIEKKFTELGGKVYHLVHVENVKSIAGKSEVTEIINAISALEDELKKKEEELENIGVAYPNVESEIPNESKGEESKKSESVKTDEPDEEKD